MARAVHVFSPGYFLRVSKCCRKARRRGTERGREARNNEFRHIEGCALGPGHACFGVTQRIDSPGFRRRRRCQEAGMDGYVSKPIRAEALRTEIERVTGGNMPKQTREAAAERPRQNDWDLKELMERLGGDEEFLRELLVIFRQDARTNLEKSRKAMAELDFDSLTRTAHTLKGMLRNLSMGAAGETAAAMENASRKKQQADSKELLGKLVKDLDGILPEVEAQLAGVRL
jgi:HPt (histidine-containing phosphotransfer) domain-containing protein